MELTLIFTLGVLLAVSAALPLIAMKSHFARRLRELWTQHTAYVQRVEAEAPDAMFAIDESGTIRAFNPAAETLFGFTEAEILGRGIANLIPAAGGSAAQGINTLHAARKTPNGIGLESTARRKDGTHFQIDVRLSEATEDGRRLFHAVARDLTERRRSEENAQDARFLDSLLHSVGAPVLVLDRDGKIIRQNRAFQELTDYPATEAQSRYYWELLLPAEEWSRLKVSLAQVIASGTSEKGEFSWRTKSGETTSMYLVLTALRVSSTSADSAIIVGFQLPEKRDEDFASSHTMEAVERLAGGIAQQFNNLLTSINGYSDLLLYSIDAQNPARRDVEEIRKAGDRAAALTSQLLAFSRKQPMKNSVFQLNDLIAAMKPTLDVLMGESIKVSTTLDLNLGHSKADLNWMEQVILNLAVNARDAMPDGGKLTLETGNTDLDATSARRFGRLPEGEYVQLTVTDTGCGMDATVRSHAFEPFYTTKRSGVGLGLGLSTVYGVVRQSGGNVIVQSVPGKGTSVRILLPRHAAEEGVKKALYLVRGAGARK